MIRHIGYLTLGIHSPQYWHSMAIIAAHIYIFITVIEHIIFRCKHITISTVTTPFEVGELSSRQAVICKQRTHGVCHRTGPQHRSVFNTLLQLRIKQTSNICDVNASEILKIWTSYLSWFTKTPMRGHAFNFTTLPPLPTVRPPAMWLIDTGPPKRSNAYIGT
jgi:hypothetical protein